MSDLEELEREQRNAEYMEVNAERAVFLASLEENGK